MVLGKIFLRKMNKKLLLTILDNSIGLVTRVNADGFIQSHRWDAKNGESVFTARNSKGKMRKYIIHELFDVDKVILGSV